MKKYELVKEMFIDTAFGKLFCIRALVKISGRCEIGDLGGYVAGEKNLSQDDRAWVSGNALVYGDAWVSGDAQILWLSKVGSANGTLTAYPDKNGNIIVTRGCFIGTLAEFAKAVKETHGNSKIAKEYAVLIKFIKLRLEQPTEAEHD